MLARGVSVIEDRVEEFIYYRVKVVYPTKCDDTLMIEGQAISRFSPSHRARCQYVIKASHNTFIYFIHLQPADWEVQSTSELKVDALGDKERYTKLVSV